jgi:hypothetical protein
VKTLFFILSFLCFLLFDSHSFAYAPNDSSEIKKEKFIPLVVGTNAAYVGSMAYLSRTWYQNQARGPFHFFNDNPEWLQMDKMGHAFSAFHMSKFSIEALKWSGVPEKKAIFWGGISGFIYLTPIELLDGYSLKYGASWGDMLANATGSALVLGQYLLWGKTKAQMKFSFSPSSFAALRPNVLGSNLPEQLLKDYNGQTYWFAFNIKSLTNAPDGFPAWLNFSLGYSGNNMIYGRTHENIAAGFNPYRQYFLSMDIDFSHVKVNNRILKVLLYPLNIVHIPFPALELNRKGISFHPIYF